MGGLGGGEGVEPDREVGMAGGDHFVVAGLFAGSAVAGEAAAGAAGGGVGLGGGEGGEGERECDGLHRLTITVTRAGARRAALAMAMYIPQLMGLVVGAAAARGRPQRLQMVASGGLAEVQEGQ